MNTLFFCPKWGQEQLSWDDFCKKVKDNGYDGVEAGLNIDNDEGEEAFDALTKYGLKFIGQYYQSFESDFNLHIQNFEKYIRYLSKFRTIKIDSQTGKDYFTVSQNESLFELSSQLEEELGITICHETHRNKALFASHVSKSYLENNPKLKITADFSHWCNVSESLLEQQPEAVEIACNRAFHIHARVGYSQSAQVVDPRLEMYKDELTAHVSWWDRIIDLRKSDPEFIMTITPEFGPFPYMIHLPDSKTPISNQWEINLFMKELLKNRYQ
ncbi:MAG: sugar phosphate isomerase/epimerase family protein [Leadbetterella sp.]